jgi:hypothetical protein
VGCHRAKGAGGEGPPPRACEGAGGGVAHRGEEGEGKIEREREREREGELTSGSKSGDHRLQNLGHHGERERWRRGGCYAGKLNERKGEKGGGRAWGRGRASEARGPERAGWAGLGRAGSRAGTEAHNTREHRSESKSRNETERNMRLSTASDKEI